MTGRDPGVVVRPLTHADLPDLDLLEPELFGAGAWSRAALAEELEGPGRWYVGSQDAVTGAATDPERVVELVAGPAVAHPASVAADGIAGAVVVGRGATLYPDDLPLTPGAPLDPDPAELARLALRRLAADPGAVLPTEPLYLRRPDAVPPAERKRVLG